MLTVAVTLYQFWAGYIVSRRITSELSLRLLLALLGLPLQIGAVAIVLSPFRLLHFSAYLIVSAALAAIVAMVAVRFAPEKTPSAEHGRPPLWPPSLPLSICGVLGAISLLYAIRVPFTHGDVLMYHASRCLYWIQNGSLFHFPTHNDRDVMFTFGADLLLLHGFLLSAAEWPARLVHCLGFVAGMLGVYRTARLFRLDPDSAAWAVVVFAGTPLVFDHAFLQKPELWLVAALGAASEFTVRASAGQARKTDLVLLGGLAALAVDIRITALPVLILLLPPLCTARAPATILRVALLVTGFVGVALISGLVLNLAGNLRHYGSCFGPQRAQIVHRADLGAAQLAIHAERFLLFAAEYPFPLDAATQARLEEKLNAFSHRIGADWPLDNPEGLAVERANSWPGLFRIQLGPEFARFSWFFIPFLVAVGFMVWRLGAGAVNFSSADSIPRLGVAAFYLVFTGLTVLLLRWQQVAPLPARFLVPPVGFAAVCLLWLWHRVPRHSCRYQLGVIGLAVCLCPMVSAAAGRLAVALEGASGVHQFSEFNDAAAHLAAGDRVLLLASQSAKDYVLFRADLGYQVTVLPWGKQPYNESELSRWLAVNRPTYVLIGNDVQLDQHWNPPIDTREFVTFFSSLSGGHRIPLADPHIFFLELPHGSLERTGVDR